MLIFVAFVPVLKWEDAESIENEGHEHDCELNKKDKGVSHFEITTDYIKVLSKAIRESFLVFLWW